MQFSKRLQAVADFVTPGCRVADIGCDHAYLSIYLADNNISPYIVAMDINKGPLKKAQENIKKYGQEGRVHIRRSNGLRMLEADEVDTLVIAGMGGTLMLEILSERMDVLASVQELILQPQSEIHLVREALSSFGFLITAESMLVEEGKYYTCIKAEARSRLKDCKRYELTEEEHFFYGRLLLEQKHPILLELIKKERQQCEIIYETLILFPTDQSLLRQKEIAEEIILIDRGLGYYKKQGGLNYEDECEGRY